MTRIDVTTGEWHKLLAPVIPHASTDTETPGLCVVRIEAAQHALYAVATDRYSLAAERHPLGGHRRLSDPPPPVHCKLSDIAASLKLFTYSKDSDPLLDITIDTTTVPVRAAGRDTSVRQLAVTIQSDDGTRLVLHDQRDPTSDPLAGWRKTLHGAMTRPQAIAAPALHLSASQLARWSKAARKGERLAMFTGSKGDQLVLIAVEDHFLGVWQPQSYLESPAKQLAESPWAAELEAEAPFLATASGLMTGAVAEAARAEGLDVEVDDGGRVATITLPPGAFRQPDDGPPPWVDAEFPGKCSGCESPIEPGDEIQADGSGGWLCEDCGTGDDAP